MITWVTVWVLTVQVTDIGYRERSGSNYQLTYATQSACIKSMKNHKHDDSYKKKVPRCDFQQIPVVTK